MTNLLAGMGTDELKRQIQLLHAQQLIHDIKDVKMTIWTKSHWLFGLWMPMYAEYSEDGMYK
jgi:hypothetical protein